MKKLLTTCAVLLLAAFFGISTAFAQGAGAGYRYPNTSGTPCSPGCDGVRVNFKVPTPTYVGTNSESQNHAFIYVGIYGGSHGTQCTLGSGTNNPLLQFGISAYALSGGAISYETWWEAHPCNNVQVYGSLVINAGDEMNLELLCTANCTSGSGSSTWRMTWTNLTTGLNQVRNDTSGWNVFHDFAQIAVELSSSGTNSASNQPLHFVEPIRFSNAQIHQGGDWIPFAVVGDAPPARITQDAKQIRCLPTPPSSCGTSASVYHKYGVSTTIDSDTGPSFNVCSTVTTTTSTVAPPCPYSNYKSTNGIGASY